MKTLTVARAVLCLAALAAAGCTTTLPPKPHGASPPRQLFIPPPRASVTTRKVYPPIARTPQFRPALKQSLELPGLGNGAEEIVERDGPPDPRDIPSNLARIPDPVPRHEPRSAGGNRPKYEVFGRSYKVMASSRAFRETGLASWYGTKFHGRKTSNGEEYDMFELTAAHKHLPLPTYARVTNLGNGKSVIVRINDRGPFHPGRVIDLSYAAAVRLDTVNRIAMVEVEAITPGKKLPPPPKLQLDSPASVYAPPGSHSLQVAAYSDPINAIAIREELSRQGFKPVQVRAGKLDNGDAVHRVMVGPFAEYQNLDQMRKRLRAIGYEAISVPYTVPESASPALPPAARTARR